MALNDYEHVNEARAVASAVSGIRDIVKDGLDQGDILPLIGQISAIVEPVQKVLNSEDKAEFEAKFAGVVGAIFLAREARKLPAGKVQSNLLIAAQALQDALEVNLPDEA